MLESVSIIVPVAPNETAHDRLLEDLKNVGAEIITASEKSRAKSLNAGAARADRTFLWFLHADSRVTAENVRNLEQALTQHPGALHYFGLAYEEGGLTNLNAWGANLRSRLLGLPYGDQGFCIAKTAFEKIGRYPENPAYGEDVLFVRLAKKSGTKLNRIPSKLKTSARKYRQYGWLKLTALRQWQMIKLMRQAI